MDAKTVSGKLITWDTFTLALDSGTPHPILVYKQSIAYMVVDGAEVKKEG